MHLRWHICAETFRRIASNYVVPAVCIGVPRPPLKTGWSAARKKIVSAKKLPTGKKKREKREKEKKEKEGAKESNREGMNQSNC